MNRIVKPASLDPYGVTEQLGQWQAARGFGRARPQIQQLIEPSAAMDPRGRRGLASFGVAGPQPPSVDLGITLEDLSPPPPIRPDAAPLSTDRPPPIRMTNEEARELIRRGLAVKDPNDPNYISADAVTPGFVEGLPIYQQNNRQMLGGYLDGPEGASYQFWNAPAGGWVRRGLQGQRVLGHKITPGQARMAEQAAAGALAVGVGVPALLAAASELSNPQTPGTIPMS